MLYIIRKLCGRYYMVKYLISFTILALLLQVIIAVFLFPLDRNSNKINGNIEESPSNPSQISAALQDVKVLENKEKITILRTEELDFIPSCKISNRDAISAIHRAKSQKCKQAIVNITCQIVQNTFYADNLPNSCPSNGVRYGQYLGCYKDEKLSRLLSNFHGNYVQTNTPSSCINMCLQAGLPYAGVQYGSECFCGDVEPPSFAKLDEPSCNMKCPGDITKICGGYFTVNVYETGLNKFTPVIPISPSKNSGDVRIIFLLTLNGRALRQVHRLINALYRRNHYFYIHVDARQDYLYRMLLQLEKKYRNVKIMETRFSTIWGGASLLQMLLRAMKDFFVLDWEWDYVINLSESDFPIKPLEQIESFLAANKGLNFVKSHGREVQKFIKKQGLDRSFVECETHMWRIGERTLPTGIVIDGGSDWLALSPEFVSYVVGPNDTLLSGLFRIFEHTLLPAESFFHTALRNSKFCNTYVDNNLHVTNWKRKLGCKCQYKHIVDWCGCSPNDFRVDDWARILNTQDKQLFFARKFEPIINQEIINRVEKWIGFHDHLLLPNLHSYWQNVYSVHDISTSNDDVILTHANSIIRHNARVLFEEDCIIEPGLVIEITSYHNSDMYKGNLILHKALVSGQHEVLIETWYKPQNNLEVDGNSCYSDNVKIFKVGSDYDQKEMVFRNFANVLSPLAVPILMYQLSGPIEKSDENFTLVWIDPTGLIAESTELHLDNSNLTNFIKPEIKAPLVPGTWKVLLIHQSAIVVQTKFLITPLQYFSGKAVIAQEVDLLHSGSQATYKNNVKSKFSNFLPTNADVLLLQKLLDSNSKRVGEELIEWIDSLTYMFYNILGSCISVSKVSSEVTCGSVLKACSTVNWSTLAPDPKGSLGQLNEITGRLDRIF